MENKIENRKEIPIETKPNLTKQNKFKNFNKTIKIKKTNGAK